MEKKTTKTATRRIGATKSNIPADRKKKKSFLKPENTRIISVCNQKGGCGKTTSVVNIAAGLAALGQKVLVIDLDAQCNSTSWLGIDPDEVESSIFNLLVDPKNCKIEDVILETEYDNLHIAPGSIELAEFESRVANEIGRENKLKKAIAQLPNHFYDFILIDTPPSLGLLSVNSLNAANEVHIAMQAHPFAFDGLNLLLNTIEQVKEELNPQLLISGIIITMFDPRTKISREIVERVTAMEDLREKIYESFIRQNVKITEASKVRRPVMYYDPLSTGAEDYKKLSEEMCKRNTLIETSSKTKVTSKSTPGASPADPA